MPKRKRTSGSPASESDEAVVMVPLAAIQHVIGKQGAGLRSLREATGCQLDVPRQEVSGHRLVRIRGPARGVQRCEELVHDICRREQAGGKG